MGVDTFTLNLGSKLLGKALTPDIPTPPKPPAPPQAPKIPDLFGRLEQAGRRGKKGLASTIATTPLGIPGLVPRVSANQPGTKTLLGQ
jgi:hypothetical protein